MPNPADKTRLLELMYQHSTAVMSEKAATLAALNAEIDRVRLGTPYSRNQVKDLLHKDGYCEYARRRKLQDHAGF